MKHHPIRNIVVLVSAASVAAAAFAAPAYALTDINLDERAASSGEVKLANQLDQGAQTDQSDANSDAALPDSEAMPDNPTVELPDQVSSKIADDDTVVSGQYAVTSEGELKNIETGETVTDPELVGTPDAPADPLAKTDGASFIPVDASEVKDKVAANGGDTNAATSNAEGATEESDSAGQTLSEGSADGQTQSQAGQPQSAQSSKATVSGTVRLAALQNKNGAYWGSHKGASAFYAGNGALFVQEAKGVIDVSEHNGVIDWQAVKNAGVDGVIIRIGYGAGNLDVQAKRNVAECKRLGIPFGIYLYSYAYDADFAAREGDSLAKMMQQLGIKNSDLAYPVYYDLEKWTWTHHQPPTKPSDYDDIVNTWYARMKAAGYTNLGVYSYTNYLQGPLNSTNIHAKVSWVAQYASQIDYTDWHSNLRGWQYSSQGQVAGIAGRVDLNAFGYAAMVTIPIYRVYNRNSGLHHYTMNTNEVSMLVKKGWKDEKESFRSVSSGIPVYRVYNPNDGNHLFTMNRNESVHLVSLGWKDEGIAWYVRSQGKQPVYRLYNPNSGEHVFTTNKVEYDKVGKAGWHQEHIAWYSA